MIDLASVARELPAHDVAAEWFARTKRWEPLPEARSRPLFRLPAAMVPARSAGDSPSPAAILDVKMLAPAVLAGVQRRTAPPGTMAGSPLAVAEVAAALCGPEPTTGQATASVASEWIG